MEALDRAAGSVLRLKFELGLFENPYTEDGLVEERLHCQEHQDLTMQASRNSLILLKNDNHTLPFSKDIKSIALIGNLASVSAIGGYSPIGARGVTIEEGLENLFGGKVKINSASKGLSADFVNISEELLSPSLDQTAVKGLNVEYFNNLDLEGEPVYRGIDANLSPYWHNLSPAPGVNPDLFSARWSGYLNVEEAGKYEFNYVADDRGRMMIDDKVVIDNWDVLLANKPSVVTLDLAAGKHKIVIEYAELDTYAGMRTNWRTATRVDKIEDNVKSAIEESDVVIVVIGEGKDEVGEAKDRSDLNLTPIDRAVIEAAYRTDKPLAVVHLSGRPLILTDVDQKCPAIVQAWFAGERGGDAIAELLFGDINPSGHLTITFPKSQGQLPMYYSRAPASDRTHIDNDGRPLYPFGHGLSYTDFEYSDLKLSKRVIKNGESVELSVTVKNIGDRDGADVVQLYLRDRFSSVTTPIIALKGFSRVDLKAGESRVVHFTLAPEHMSLINIDMERVVEPGDFDVMIGKSSRDIILRDSFCVE